MQLKECTFVWSDAAPAERVLPLPGVVNVRTATGLSIGRAMPARGARAAFEASDWQNEFKPADDGAEARAEAIMRYVVKLLESPHRCRLGELAGQDLACWCAPKLCHGDALAELITATRFYGSACPHCGGPVDSFLNWHAGLSRLTEAWVCRAKTCGRRGDRPRAIPRCLTPQPALL